MSNVNRLTSKRKGEDMSRNPRRFRQPIRLIVSVEAQTVDAIDAYMNAGGYHGHRNRSEFVRRALGDCRT